MRLPHNCLNAKPGAFENNHLRMGHRQMSSCVLQDLMDKLKAKRFRQIFDYLDADGTGQLDLIGLAFEVTNARVTMPCLALDTLAFRALAI